MRAPTHGRIAEAVERIFKVIRPGERILSDLIVTHKPKSEWTITPETQSDELDANDMYSATYEWLAEFAGFCRRSAGFEVL